MAKKEYEESIGEMKHADKLMARILVLGGLPNLQDLGKLLVGENVPKILNGDLQSERGAQATTQAWHRPLRGGGAKECGCGMGPALISAHRPMPMCWPTAEHGFVDWITSPAGQSTIAAY